MSIDLVTFSAFALESYASPAAATGDGHTLTLPLRASRTPGADPMAGRVTLIPTEPVLGRIQHAGIVEPILKGPLTITF